MASTPSSSPSRLSESSPSRIKIHNCIVERCRLVRSGHLSGEELTFVVDREEYRIEPCNTPLFSDKEEAFGVCNSCLSGWEHPDNSPTPKGRETIRVAKIGLSLTGTPAAIKRALRQTVKALRGGAQ